MPDTHNGRVKLVCFDLGGVLVRICRSWAEGCRLAGLDVRGDFVRGSPHVEGWPELRRNLQTGVIDRAGYARSLSAGLGNLYTADEIERIHKAWLIGEYEGACEVIDRIHEAGLPTSSLSNTDEAHWEQMRDWPVLQRLRHRHASHLLGEQKPDEAIYRVFERKVGFAGGEIIFFDDLPENVAAARAVGWCGVQIDPMSRTDVQIAAALQQHGVL